MAWTDHARGAALAVALLGHAIYAVPFTERITSADLENPGRQRSLQAWADTINGLGIAISDEELEQHVVDVTRFVNETHQTLKTPYKPVFQLTNTNQQWGLFASATTRPETIVVDVKRAGSDEWETLLRRLDPCCTWREDQFRYRRIRGLWDGLKKSPRPGFRYLVRWIGRRAFEDFDDVEHVRVYMDRGRSTYPWRPPKPERETRHMWQVSRTTYEAGAL